jgi:hypothetical protein
MFRRAALCYDGGRIYPIFHERSVTVARGEATSRERKSRRRSLRIVMRVPLYVSPADAPSTDEWEPVETLVISLHGGLIRSRQKYPIGTTLDIRVRNKPRFTRGRVVWTAEGTHAPAFEVGFEILGPPGFWEINFPEDRWSEREQAAQ